MLPQTDKDNGVIDDLVLPDRMNAHFFRLFLDACDDGIEHQDSMRRHGRRINETIFGLASVESLRHRNDIKRRQTNTQFAARHFEDVDRLWEQGVPERRVHNQRKASCDRARKKFCILPLLRGKNVRTNVSTLEGV